LDSRPRDPQRTFRRADVYRAAVVDGQLVDDTARARSLAWIRGLLTSRAERDEATLERRLRALNNAVTRCNVVAVLSPKGGVGKTTCAFVLGNLLAGHVRLRTIVVDANPDHGTLGLLAPDATRSVNTLADAIANLDRISSASELRPYVSVLPSGLHLMGAPADPRVMKQMTPELYGQLTMFLGHFYDVVLLDLGTGLTDSLTEFAIARVDQSVVVTTPEWMTASIVLDALRYLGGEQGNDHITVVLNKALRGSNAGDRQRIEAEFRRQQIARRVTIPEDEQLMTMLDSGTYTLERLRRPCRVPIKELGLAVAGQLV
jgi:MinD-like ATPase involved in chromosome partitioning or flagellar assembly